MASIVPGFHLFSFICFFLSILRAAAPLCIVSFLFSIFFLFGINRVRKANGGYLGRLFWEVSDD